MSFPWLYGLISNISWLGSLQLSIKLSNHKYSILHLEPPTRIFEAGSYRLGTRCFSSSFFDELQFVTVFDLSPQRLTVLEVHSTICFIPTHQLDLITKRQGPRSIVSLQGTD